MVLFKSRLLHCLSILNNHLHSTMVLFKSLSNASLRTSTEIYIPLWSYSNQTRTNMLTKKNHHLHSTMVLFKSVFQHLFFHSLAHLHSTMVLFKSKWLSYKFNKINIYIPLWSYSNEPFVYFLGASILFTFHYGPIQITFYYEIYKLHSNLHSTMVLFKYLLLMFPSLVLIIYIPLWSYSNKNTLLQQFKLQQNLHSTMVLFKLYISTY